MTDTLLARYQAESEEKSKFIDGLVEQAQNESRDLTGQEMELLTRTKDRIHELTAQIDPLRDAAQIARTSRDRTAEIAREFATARGESSRTSMEYRSAGEYVLDYWRSRLGDEDAKQRMELWQRAAAHQTTGDNPGLLPESILGPVVNFVDSNRPIVNALGPRQLPGGSWSRPSVTGHTLVQPQTAEKTELASQKMTISKIPVSPKTYGGYVNVSRQDADWTQPSIMDLIISDLAAQYAIETESATANDLLGVAIAGPTLPAAPTPEEVAGAFWGGAASIYNATYGQGRLIAVTGPDMLALLGPLFPPVNPVNAQSAGLTAEGFDRRGRLDRRHSRLRVRPDGSQDDHCHVDRRGRGIRGPHRAVAGRRAQRARHSGRVRRLFREPDDPARRHHQDRRRLMPTDWYAPNQQAVRPDGSGPAEQGDGGSRHDDTDDTVDEGQRPAAVMPPPSPAAHDPEDDPEDG